MPGSGCPKEQTLKCGLVERSLKWDLVGKGQVCSHENAFSCKGCQRTLDNEGLGSHTVARGPSVRSAQGPQASAWPALPLGPHVPTEPEGGRGSIQQRKRCVSLWPLYNLPRLSLQTPWPGSSHPSTGHCKEP